MECFNFIFFQLNGSSNLSLYIILLLNIQMSERSEKNQKFANEIRRRHRQDIFKKDRELFQVAEKSTLQSSIKQTIALNQPQNVTSKYAHIHDLYESFKNSNNFLQSVSEIQLQSSLQLLLNLQSISTLEGATVLGSYIQFCGGLNKELQTKKNMIKSYFEHIKIEEILFELLISNFNAMQNKKVKMYLFCIKNMALSRMQSLLKKNLLQKYLPFLIENMISQQSVLILLAYISEVHPFSPQLIKVICNQVTSNQMNTKIFILSILNNYISVQQNRQSLFLLFQLLLKTMQYLYINCRSYGYKYSEASLRSINYLIAKFPDQMGHHLLSKIANSKFQDTAIVIFNVSSENTKEMVYQIQQTIVDKSIDDLGPQFFKLFSGQMIDHFILGIQHTNNKIVFRCLKILAKLLFYAPLEVAHNMDKHNELSYVLQDLEYSKNDGISSLASSLSKYFQYNNENKEQLY